MRGDPYLGLPLRIVETLGPNFSRLAPAIQRAHVAERYGIGMDQCWTDAERARRSDVREAERQDQVLKNLGRNRVLWKRGTTDVDAV